MKNTIAPERVAIAVHYVDLKGKIRGFRGK